MEADDDETPARKPSEPVTVTLRKPIEVMKESVSELTLKPHARAFKELSLPMSAEGKIDFQPYPMALVGLKMAGHSADAAKLIDKLDPRDLMDLAQAVLSFFI